MKGRKLKSILKIVVTLMLIFVAAFISYQDKSHADAGYHSSYSGGSSHSSSSSHSSYSSSHSSSRRSSSSGSYSSGSPASGLASFFIAFVFCFIIIILFIIISNNSNNIKNKGRFNIANGFALTNNQQAIDEIKKHLPGFDVNKFLSNGFNIYMRIEEAWMNFELDKVRDIITDEMFNMYESQLTSMEMKGEQNIMKDFKLLNSAITNASVQNDMLQVTTRYVIEFYDYIIKKDTKQVVRGNSNRKIRMIYEMTFVEKLGKTKLDKCPNCGAPIKVNSAGICEYCNSKIVDDNTEWVMSKKISLYQQNL